MFVGESGQGKTSLLSILAKLALPTAGTVSSELTVTVNSEITEWRTRFFTFTGSVASVSIMLSILFHYLLISKDLRYVPPEEHK